MDDVRTGDEQSPLVYTSQARVQALDGPTDTELLNLIKKRARDPSIFSERPPYTWRAEASNSTLDAYMTRMDVPSLRNYARDATAGVMFLDSHDKRQLGYGQSIRGEFVGAAAGAVDGRQPDDKDPARVLIDFYTIPGIQLGRVSSDSFIAGVQAGIINDVSIGFLPERFECNLCGKDPFDWWSMECMHVPGAYYDEGGKQVVTPRTKGAVQAFAWVRNAHLSEVSAVFDGATTGAYIQKAKFLAEAGEVSRQVATLLERQLRIRLPTPSLQGGPGARKEDGMARRYRQLGNRSEADLSDDEEAVAATPPPDDEDAAVETPPPPPPSDDAPTVPPEVPPDPAPTPPSENANLKREESPEGIAGSSGGITSPAHTDPEDLRMSTSEERVRALEAQALRDAEMIRQVRQVLATGEIADAETVDPGEGVRRLVARIGDLAPRAKLGDDYRAEVIEAALESGVRMDGNEFDRDGWSATFATMDVPHIRRMGSGWERIAQAALPAGRKTAEVGTDPQIDPKTVARNGQADAAQYSTR
jgi:hypothetical protein